MIQNIAESVVLNALIKSLVAEEDSKYKDIKKGVDFYLGAPGNISPYIEQYINTDEKDIPFSFTNITRRIINRRSQVYKRTPSRFFEKEYTKYDEVIGNKNVYLKEAERYTRLIGTTALRVMWDTDGYFRYQSIPYFKAYFNGDQFKPYAIAYPLKTGAKTPEFWAYWDPENHFVMDNQGIKVGNQAAFGVNDGMINPYGVLPFAFLHKSVPVLDFWTVGSDDIIDANEKIDLAMTELNYGIRYGTFNQPYGTGIEKTDKIKVGYNQIMALSSGEATLGVLNIDAKIINIIEGIKFQFQVVERNNDLGINWGMEGAPSGFSLVVQNIDLLVGWEDDIEVCRMWEEDIYELEKVVGKIDGRVTLPDNMRVDFAEVEFPVNPEEERARWEWEWTHGLSSKIDYLKSKSPDTPEDELKKQLEENAKLSSEIKSLEKPKPLTFEERLGGVNA